MNQINFWDINTNVLIATALMLIAFFLFFLTFGKSSSSSRRPIKTTH